MERFVSMFKLFLETLGSELLPFPAFLKYPLPDEPAGKNEQLRWAVRRLLVLDMKTYGFLDSLTNHNKTDDIEAETVLKHTGIRHFYGSSLSHEVNCRYKNINVVLEYSHAV